MTSDQLRTPPFELNDGDTGVLMLHGYSGSPSELQPMSEAIHAAGYTVHAPLLAGHGGSPADLNGVPWQAWLASAQGGLQRIQERCSQVFICGFSAGGLLALHLAAHMPPAGLILLAPALMLRGGRLLRTTGILKYIVPWYYPLAKADFSDPEVRASVLEHAHDADLDDPAVVAAIRREAKISVGSLYELAKLQKAVGPDLRRIQVPTLILQGTRDRTVNPRSASEVYKRISSEDRQLVWFDNSGHQLPNEAEREQVWKTAVEWLRERN